MAAPIGSQFWKLGNPGRDKTFATPEELWGKACEYFQWCDEHPIIQKDWVGKDADEVEREKPVPYTLDGLCFYLGITDDTLRNYGKEKGYELYFGVYTRIMQVVRAQKFTGAAVGLFNASIIARDLGLSEKTENNNTNKNEYKVTLKLK